MKKLIIGAIVLSLCPTFTNSLHAMEQERKTVDSGETAKIKEPIIIDASTIPVKQKFGLTTKRQFYSHPSKIVFELWNKLPHKIYFRVSEKKNWPVFDEEYIYALEPNHLIALKDDHIDISKPHVIYFYNLFKKLTNAYEIAPGKTIFVRLKEDKNGNQKFGPQTGALKGLAGLNRHTRNQTDTGLSKENNVFEKDIVPLKFDRELTLRSERHKTPEGLTPETMTREWALKYIGLDEWYADKDSIKQKIKYYRDQLAETKGLDPDTAERLEALFASIEKILLSE